MASPMLYDIWGADHTTLGLSGRDFRVGRSAQGDWALMRDGEMERAERLCHLKRRSQVLQRAIERPCAQIGVTDLLWGVGDCGKGVAGGIQQSQQAEKRMGDGTGRPIDEREIVVALDDVACRQIAV